ncbi:NUDIX domain-containing protein [Curtobacterium sp. MCBA15_001]|uniref:NUDIX domain-containing protein n=1 Tax=Curtobacterium sp. MCBA15_001 TaxID=1898731 RepID=UPI0008DCDA8F|nr:NUDIX domain-containing protein [Curtobacterium sp. MCBA15_001]OIH93740.1 hypothetical protein BIU90_08900 [Curtobacterium sp. MCBA15_001]
MRIRSAAVVVRDHEVLVIRREQDGRRYCVLPGGGVERSETLRQACRRELLEETGLDGTVGELLDTPVDSEVPVAYFAVRVDSATVGLALGGPELGRASEHNRYTPHWVPVDALEAMTLVPDEARIAVQLVLGRHGA